MSYLIGAVTLSVILIVMRIPKSSLFHDLGNDASVLFLFWVSSMNVCILWLLLHTIFSRSSLLLLYFALGISLIHVPLRQIPSVGTKTRGLIAISIADLVFVVSNAPGIFADYLIGRFINKWDFTFSSSKRGLVEALKSGHFGLRLIQPDQEGGFFAHIELESAVQWLVHLNSEMKPQERHWVSERPFNLRNFYFQPSGQSKLAVVSFGDNIMKFGMISSVDQLESLEVQSLVTNQGHDLSSTVWAPNGEFCFFGKTGVGHESIFGYCINVNSKKLTKIKHQMNDAPRVIAADSGIISALVDSGTSSSIFIYDSSGQFKGKIDLPVGASSDNLNVHDMAVQSDGTIWVLESNQHFSQVLKISKPWNQIQKSKRLPYAIQGEFIKVMADGNVLVSLGHGSLAKLNPNLELDADFLSRFNASSRGSFYVQKRLLATQLGSVSTRANSDFDVSVNQDGSIFLQIEYRDLQVEQNFNIALIDSDGAVRWAR